MDCVCACVLLTMCGDAQQEFVPFEGLGGGPQVVPQQ
jgi:hypothetical protein